MTEPSAAASTRRMATVKISAPAASSARSRSPSDRNPPLPTISREPHVRPPSSSPPLLTWPAVWSATLDRPHYLDRLALAQVRPLPLAARDDLTLDGDRHSSALVV